MRGNQDLVVGSDYVRGPKFRLYEYGLLNENDLGYYLVAANVSDIAAMGAQPIGVLTVVRYPPDMPDSRFLEVMDGIHKACAEFGAPNVGGDIGGAERLFLSATALGVCEPGKAVLRSGAQPGDVLCLSGPTGIAGAAMQYFRFAKPLESIERRHRESLLAAWKRPQARVREGICLGQTGLATSCQDTSDGLKATIEGIAAASGVGFEIDERRVPITNEVGAVAKHISEHALKLVMGDSVDFELAFTVPERSLPVLKRAFSSQNLDFWAIGRATADAAILLRLSDGTSCEIPGQGWRHAPERGSSSH